MLVVFETLLDVITLKSAGNDDKVFLFLILLYRLKT